MRLLNFVPKYEEHFLFFIFRPGLSDIRINRNRINEGLLYVTDITTFCLTNKRTDSTSEFYAIYLSF
jgi:hypothetical protein